MKSSRSHVCKLGTSTLLSSCVQGEACCSFRLSLQFSQLSLLLVTPSSWYRSLWGAFLAHFLLSSLWIPQARSFLSQYIMVWCNFIYAVIAHICIPVRCVQLSHLETSLERQRVAFIVPFPGSFVKYSEHWGWGAAAVCCCLFIWCSWILLQWWVCQVGWTWCVVTLGAILPSCWSAPCFPVSLWI